MRLQPRFGLLRPVAAALGIALASAALPALAADAVFLVVSGEVDVVRGSAARAPARSGDELQSGDLIVTSANGRAQLRFTDGAIVSLQPRTEFRIDDYRFDVQEQRGFFSLLRGALRTATGAIGKRNQSDYRMQTPTATIGIRGTMYTAEETVCDPACWPGPRAGLRVSVSEGRIAVRTSAGEIEVGAGSAAETPGPNALPRLTELRPVLSPTSLAMAAQPGTETSANGGSTPRNARPASPILVAGAAGQVSGGTHDGSSGQGPAGSSGSDSASGPASGTAAAAGTTGNGSGAEGQSQQWPAAWSGMGGVIAPASNRAPDGKLDVLVAAAGGSSGGSAGGGSSGGGSSGGGSTGGGAGDGGSSGGGSSGGGSSGGGSTGGGSDGSSTGGGSTGGGSSGGGSTGGGSSGGGSTGGGSSGGGSDGGSTGDGSTGGGSSGGGSSGDGSSGGGTSGGGSGHGPGSKGPGSGGSTGGGSSGGGSSGGGSGGGSSGGGSSGGGSSGGGSSGGGSSGGGSTGGGSGDGGSSGGGSSGGGSDGGSTGGGSSGGGSDGGSTGGGSTGGGSDGGGSTGGGSSDGGGSTGGGSTGGGSSGGGSGDGGSTGGGSDGGGSTGGGSDGGGSTGGGSDGGGSTGGGSTGGGSDGGGSTGGGSDGGGSTGGGSTPEVPLAPGLNEAARLRVEMKQVPLYNSLQFTSGSSQVDFDSSMRLQSVGLCPLACLSRGTAAYADTGSDPYVSWGRWTNGTAQVRLLGIPIGLSLGPNQSIHYLVGVPTVTMPTSGSFTYQLVGATSPTISDGSVAPGRLEMSAVARFSSGEATRVGLQGQVTMGSASYGIGTTGGLADPMSSELKTTTTTFGGSLRTQPDAGGNGGLACGGSGCNVQIDGGFFGPEASRMGLSYTISAPASPARTISGVGVLEKH